MVQQQSDSFLQFRCRGLKIPISSAERQPHLDLTKLLDVIAAPTLKDFAPDGAEHRFPR